MAGTRTWGRVRVLALAVLAVTCAGTGTAVGAAAAAPTYVALGDSYAAGPLIPLPIPPYGCLKSSSNYAHLAALQLGMTLRDRTCSGADTSDMTSPQGVTPGPNPPQFDALDAGTRLVTLHIGGNDIGFSSLAENCLSLWPTGAPCKARYVSGGVDRVSQRIAATAPKVAAVLQGIRSRAPSARILLLTYPAIFPHQGGGCFPLIPVATGDVGWLRAKHVELNAMLARQAAANGAEVVDAYAASVHRDACSLPVLRWVEPLVALHVAAPLHPNLTGMLGMASLVVSRAR